MDGKVQQLFMKDNVEDTGMHARKNYSIFLND